MRSTYEPWLYTTKTLRNLFDCEFINSEQYLTFYLIYIHTHVTRKYLYTEMQYPSICYTILTPLNCLHNQHSFMVSHTFFTFRRTLFLSTTVFFVKLKTCSAWSFFRAQKNMSSSRPRQTKNFLIDVCLAHQNKQSEMNWFDVKTLRHNPYQLFACCELGKSFACIDFH